MDCLQSERAFAQISIFKKSLRFPNPHPLQHSPELSFISEQQHFSTLGRFTQNPKLSSISINSRIFYWVG